MNTEEEIKKNILISNVFNEWLLLYQQGKKITPFFHYNGFRHIAVYGMGNLGMRLCDEILMSDVVIEYGIDKRKMQPYRGIEVLIPNSNLKAVDAIIVSAVFYYSEIVNELEKWINCPIISLEDIIYGSN